MKGGREERERKLQVVVTNDKIKTGQYKRLMMGCVCLALKRGGDIQVEMMTFRESDIQTMMRKSQP